MSLTEWALAAILAGFSGVASYRVWRMIALDSIFDRPRVALLNRSPGWLVDQVKCAWCLGWWLNGAAALVLVARSMDSSHFPIAAVMVWLVGSTVTGVISRGD